MNKAPYFTLLLLVCFHSLLYAQNYLRVPDNPADRVNYETRMLVNPTTGKIPESIRNKELSYVLSPKSGLQPTIDHRRRGGGTSTTVWNRRGPYNVGGRTRALALDKTNENIILAGGVSGGMWRSIDGGANWAKTTGASDRHSVTHVAQDPINTNIWYYTTGESVGNSSSGGSAAYRGNGVYKSTDGGITWVLLASTTGNPTVFGGSANNFQYCWRVAVNPVNSDVYVAAWGGIYQSTNGGTNWTRVLDGGGIAARTARYTDISISSKGVFYATLSSSGSPKKGIFRSTDGTTWTSITPAELPVTYNRIVLDIAPSNENLVYFFATTPGSGTNEHSFYKYTYTAGQGNGDGTLSNGGTWEDRSSNLPAFGGEVGNLAQANYNQYVKIKPDDENVVFIGSTNIYRTTDGFATTNNNTWIGGYSPRNNVNTYPNHHPDNHALVFLPSSSTTMLTGHDGGISKTTNNLGTNDGGANQPVVWESLSNGYFTSQTHAIAIDPEVAGDNRLLVGFQDNGKWFSDQQAANTQWQEEVGGGDGAYVAIVPGTNIRYISTQNGKVARVEGPNISRPVKANHVFPHVSKAKGQLFIHPFVLDPNNYNRMYYPAGTSLWRHQSIDKISSGWNFNGTQDAGWQKLSDAELNAGTISAITITHRLPANRVYYGTTNGQIYRLDDAQATTQKRTDISTGKGLPGRAYVSCLAVDPTDGNKVFVVFSNYGIQSIFSSVDGGNHWTPIGGNLEENTDGTGNGPSVRWLTVHNAGDGVKRYYAGTSTGLYSTTALNGNSTVWKQEGANTIGNVVVMMTQSRGLDGRLAVGTHGSGVYEAEVGKATTPLIGSFSPKLTGEGNEVTLRGINFDPDMAKNKIMLNGIAATIKSVTSNTIVFTVPANAKTSKITLETNGTTLNSLDELVISKFTSVPTTPNNLKVSFNGANVVLNWADNSKVADSTIIERSETSGSAGFVKIKTVVASITTFIDTDAEINKTHYYRIIGQNDFGNSTFSNLAIYNPKVLSIEDQKLAKAVSLFPNPHDGKFEVRINQAHAQAVRLYITDQTGKTVYKAKNIPRTGIRIDISQQAAGTYILHLQRGNAQASKRFVKQ